MRRRPVSAILGVKENFMDASATASLFALFLIVAVVTDFGVSWNTEIHGRMVKHSKLRYVG